MPRGTTLRSIRIDDTLWQAVQKRAAAEGVSVSEVVRTQLTAWLNRPHK